MKCTKKSDERSKTRSEWIALYMTVLGLSLSLLGCSRTGTADPSQLATKMGSDEVTLYELQRALAHQPPGAGVDVAAGRKRILDELIDQHLMADEAVRQKLDRTPDAVLDAQLCKQSVLQSAFITSIVGQRRSDAISDRNDARAFYDQHPQSFAQRQIYWMKEIVFPQHAGLDADAARKLAPADLAAFLEQHDIKYRLTFGQIGSDELSPELQKATETIEDGHSIVIPESGELVMATRLSAQAEPVTFDSAEPQIVRYLAQQQAAQDLRSQTASLRASAGVQYLNEFATPSADTKSGQVRPSENNTSIVADKPGEPQ
jgi:peptidyl-prolyl cis-trans isomerase C